MTRIVKRTAEAVQRPARRRKRDPNADPPFTEGHSTRRAWALGYPIREDGINQRLEVMIETGGVGESGRVATRITLEQNDWPNDQGELEIYAEDIPIFIATLKKAYAIALGCGVLDPAFTRWHDPEHARPAEA